MVVTPSRATLLSREGSVAVIRNPGPPGQVPPSDPNPGVPIGANLGFRSVAVIRNPGAPPTDAAGIGRHARPQAGGRWAAESGAATIQACWQVNFRGIGPGPRSATSTVDRAINPPVLGALPTARDRRR